MTTTNPPTETPPDIVFSEDQRTAIDNIFDWLDEDDQEISLGGYAGTGKTTVLSNVIKRIKVGDELDYEVLCPTGKAAHVLRKKGIREAATIHSHLYRTFCDKWGRPHFTLKPYEDIHRDLIIVDEASMVSLRLYNDLVKSADKILWVGDHGQLEPIGAHPHIMDDPDIRLEKIHRQALDNPLIDFATKVRLGNQPNPNIRIDLPELVYTKAKDYKSTAEVNENIIRICAYHKTRVVINEKFRHAQGCGLDLLCEGEPVICLRNNPDLGLFNGMIGMVVKVHRQDGVNIIVDVRMDDGIVRNEVPMLIEQFGAPNNGPKKIPKGSTIWDYAYCITCHKSQGSEWPTVIVYEQRCKAWTHERWAYTAATRASEKLIYLH